MPTSDDGIIEPVKAPLSERRGRGKAHSGTAVDHWRGKLATARSWWFFAALAVLGVAASYVFLVLPEHVDAPQLKPNDAPELADQGAERGPAGTEIVPPFQALALEQARDRAQDMLNDFVSLELTLEQDMHVAEWGADELVAIKDRASAADALFLDADYETALAEYTNAVTALRALVAKGEERFEAALAEGDSALRERDHTAAVAAFARAAAIRPQDPRAVAGTDRAAKLPEVIALLRESERASLRGDYDKAHEHLARVGELDPDTAGLAAAQAKVATVRAESRRNALLSRGFAALEANDYASALTTFDQVLRDYPDHPAALAGRQQTLQDRTRAEIDRLRQAALTELQSENWTAALVSYDKALAIDPALQFARDGRQAVRQQVDLIRAMDRVIADPALLSSDQEFAAAQETLKKAEDETQAGEKFAERVARFRGVVERGAEAVPLVLLSDNATEVTVHKVGPVGVFDRTQLKLRPGRYVIVGSRDGCRDVRKEIVLAPGMAPVDIRCAERI